MADTPHEVAERLAQTALQLAPAELESLVHRTMAATEDLDVQSRLTWIAGMYLDRHRGAFLLSRPIVDQCLLSTDYDQLLAGLKGIQHCNASTDEIISSLSAVMNRKDWDQRLAALHQLSNFLDYASQEIAATSADVADLKSVVQEMLETARDDVDRELAERCISQLEHDDVD